MWIATPSSRRCSARDRPVHCVGNAAHRGTLYIFSATIIKNLCSLMRDPLYLCPIRYPLVPFRCFEARGPF